MSRTTTTTLVALFVVTLLVGAGCAKKAATTSTPATQTPTTNDQTLTTNTVANQNTAILNANTSTLTNTAVTNTNTAPATASVSITSNGFEPSSITVRNGGTVTWKNDDTRTRQPAVDPHPAHSNLPGFDAVGGVQPGRTYSYTFTKSGTWTYHDHLMPIYTGTVVVVP